MYPNLSTDSIPAYAADKDCRAEIATAPDAVAAIVVFFTRACEFAIDESQKQLIAETIGQVVELFLTMQPDQEIEIRFKGESQTLVEPNALLHLIKWASNEGIRLGLLHHHFPGATIRKCGEYVVLRITADRVELGGHSLWRQDINNQ